MKRSDMIAKMAGDFRGAANLGSELAIFNYVLTRMEEAGIRMTGEPNRTQRVLAIMDDECPTCIYSGWELEDEKE